MKKLSMIQIAAITLAVCAELAEAGGVGNGGMAYVCRDQQTHEITKARLLDLWEPETYETIQDFNTSVKNQLSYAVERVKAFFPYGASVLNQYISEDQARIMKVKKPLIPTHDVLPRYAPEFGCAFEQVAVHGYDDETHRVVLKIYEEIFNSAKFSNTDRAALFVHEALYRKDREIRLERGINTDPDSRKSRRSIAQIFAKNGLEQLSGRERIEIAELMVKDLSLVIDVSSNKIEPVFSSFGTVTVKSTKKGRHERWQAWFYVGAEGILHRDDGIEETSAIPDSLRQLKIPLNAQLQELGSPAAGQIPFYEKIRFTFLESADLYKVDEYDRIINMSQDVRTKLSYKVSYSLKIPRTLRTETTKGKTLVSVHSRGNKEFKFGYNSSDIKTTTYPFAVKREIVFYPIWLRETESPYLESMSFYLDL